VSDPARTSALALLAVGLASAAAFFVGLAGDLPGLRLWTKAIPVLCLAAWVAAQRPDAAGRLVSLGLVLSSGGDLVLELGRFIPGLVAFLAAHLAYIGAFVSQTRRPAPARGVPVLLWCAVVLALLWPGLGSLEGPVALYVAVIGTMIWRAAARVGHAGPPTRAEWIGLVGASAFGLSDTLIALDRFLAPVPGARWSIMPLYWLGQWAIAASLASSGAED
jgi:alkenylglycerophosphocholine hydrolase